MINERPEWSVRLSVIVKQKRWEEGGSIVIPVEMKSRRFTKEMERIVFDCRICKLMNRINFRDKQDNKRKSPARARAPQDDRMLKLSKTRRWEWFVRVFAQMLLLFYNGYCIEKCLGNCKSIFVFLWIEWTDGRTARLPHCHSFSQWFDYNGCALFVECILFDIIDNYFKLWFITS